MNQINTEQKSIQTPEVLPTKRYRRSFLPVTIKLFNSPHSLPIHSLDISGLDGPEVILDLITRLLIALQCQAVQFTAACMHTCIVLILVVFVLVIDVCFCAFLSTVRLVSRTAVPPGDK